MILVTKGCDPYQLSGKNKSIVYFMEIPLELLGVLFQSHNEHIRPHNVGQSSINLSNECSSGSFNRCGPPSDDLLPDLCGSGVKTFVARAPARPNVKSPYILQHYPLFSDRKVAACFHPLRNQARFAHIVWLLRCQDGLHPQSDTLLIWLFSFPLLVLV